MSSATAEASPARGVIRRIGDVSRAYGSVIGSRGYFPLWLGQLASSFGDTLHYIALVVLVFQLTGQGLAVAGLVAVEVVPVLVLGPIAGVIIDRFSRKSVLVGSDLVRAILPCRYCGRRAPGTPTSWQPEWRPATRSSTQPSRP